MRVKLSEDLTWNYHIEYSLKTATSRLCTLRQLRKSGLNKQDLVLYIVHLWSDLTVTLTNLIESVQKRALRTIYYHPFHGGSLSAAFSGGNALIF